jgi:ribonuclease VapC
MVIDTSAVIAILNDEPERRAFNEAIEKSNVCMMSAATFVEVSMVIENKRGPDGLRDFDTLIATARIVIVPVDERQARVARDAFRRYGKGRHPAALNYGDCFTYALADVKRSPVLFKGGDFLQTDVRSAC